MIRINLNDDNAISLNHLKLFRAEASELDSKLVDQIVEKSRQPHVMKFEANEDAGGRFKNRESYQAWANKERIIYILLSSTDDVAGIIWFGKRQNTNIDSKYKLTFGIRLYEGYTGRGLSKPLMKASHIDARSIFKEQYIWLDYAESNFIAGKAYKSFGYEELAAADDRIIMGKKL